MKPQKKNSRWEAEEYTGRCSAEGWRQIVRYENLESRGKIWERLEEGGTAKLQEEEEEEKSYKTLFYVYTSGIALFASTSCP